jgi:predicted ArsR family transcriptional regulator
MLEILGERQKDFLRLLLKNKEGLTVEGFSQQLGITRNAVRQHLASLENDRLVAKSVTRPSGGRPEQLYILTERGSELFPRHYSWFAQMLMEMIEQEVGSEEVGQRLSAMGARIAKNLRGNDETPRTLPEKLEKITAVLEDLGYNARMRPAGALKGIPIIEAQNCVFHDLAKKNPAVCQFDLALLESFTDSSVIHEECMAKGGNACRFRFEEKTDS